MANGDKKDIGVRDIYDVLVKQVLPGQKRTFIELATLNTTVVELQKTSIRHEEEIGHCQRQAADLGSEVRVIGAVSEERKSHQSEKFADVKESLSEAREARMANLREIMRIAKDVAVLGGSIALLAKAVGIW